jgi:selenocysteine lyase/cysteine desulfurase
MTISTELLAKVRQRFAQIDTCPVQGDRVFFENAGGALCLNSVVDCSAQYAAIPDNQGRDNPGSHELNRVISQAKDDMHAFMNASGGQFFVGESGTELLFRLISSACLGTAENSVVLGSTLEHPATRSACARWAKIARQKHVLIDHDDATGTIEPAAYAAGVTADTVVATILHTSPVTGMGVKLAAISAEIRKVAPECFIIVDGIQHAAHGMIDLDEYNVDGYVVSPYKVFSRHGYGLAWISDRLSELPHDELIDGPKNNWELGTRDTGSYATFSEVVNYFDWLGEQVKPDGDRRGRFVAAGLAIKAQEKALTDAMINGVGNVVGLADIKGVNIIGGLDNPAREGLVGFWIDDVDSADIVKHLNENGVRTHLRKADHYSRNILDPLKQASCVRVSMCHYNTLEEVTRFLHVMQHYA